MQHMDWSAIAAWIALAISIVTPAITTLLTNRHQLKLHKLLKRNVKTITMQLAS